MTSQRSAERASGVSERELTEAQNAAIYAIDRSMSVVAGAGSGKTTVLIDRCRHIVGDDWSTLDRLLAITFTEKAAGELKARLRPLLPANERYRLENAWIGTFHACCARMLRQHAPLVGLDPAFAILDENAARLAARQAVRTTLLDMLEQRDEDAALLVDALDFRTAVGALEELMDFRWHAERALADPSSDDEEERRILAALARVFARAQEQLQNQFERAGGLDFQALEIRTLDLLRDHPEVLAAYRKRFRHLLVDEFQDTNDLQTELALTLYEPGTNQLCIVGDPRQSIYRFRGANVDCFATALERIAATRGETVHLAENFRSRHGIVAFVNEAQGALADGLFGRLTVDGISSASEGMIAARPDGAEGAAVAELVVDAAPDAKAGERREREAAAIAAFIGELVDRRGVAPADIVLLFQALTAVAPYESALRRSGVPFRLFGGRGLLGRQEIADLLAALAFAADPTDEVALLGLLRSPLVGLSDDDLVLLAGPEGETLRANALRDPRCALLGDLTAMAAHRRPSEILRHVLDATGFELLCARLDPTGGMNANVDRFRALAEGCERQEPTPLADFTRFVRELQAQSARLGDPPAAGDAAQAVRLMTVHAAKGLEFPVVLLPDLFRKPHTSGGSWQFGRASGIGFKIKDPLHPFGERTPSERYKAIHVEERAGEEAESKRLLYVAMTRARGLLLLPTHPGLTKPGPWLSWLAPLIERSAECHRFVAADGAITGPFDELRIEDKRDEERSTFAFPGHVSRVTCHVTSFTVSQLESYARCPQEYRLKYVLGAPACDLLTEGEERLPANVVGSIVHAVLERYDPTRPRELKALVETACVAHDVLPDAKAQRRIRAVVDAAAALPLFAEAVAGEREVRFDWQLGSIRINGTIDWLRPVDGGVEVLDFKTDRLEETAVPERAREYDLQLVCYALAAEAAGAGPVQTTALAFLHLGVVHREAWNDARRTDGREQIKRIVDAIHEENFAVTAEKPPCFKCPYHHNGLCWEDRLKRSSEFGVRNADCGIENR